MRYPREVVKLLDGIQDRVVGDDNDCEFKAVDGYQLGVFDRAPDSALLDSLGPWQIVPESALVTKRFPTVEAGVPRHCALVVR